MRIVVAAVALLGLVVLGVLVVSVATSSDDGAAKSTVACAGAPAPGGGLSVGEALAQNVEGDVLVRGALVVRGDEARLCSALAESHPPQCGSPSLRVEGLDVGEIEGLKEADGVRWAERVSLLGRIENDVLRVAETSI